MSFFGLYYVKNHYLRVMKLKLELKRLLLFAIISLGTFVLTRSLLVAVGALVLLFVVDYFLGIWENNRINKSEDENGKSE